MSFFSHCIPLSRGPLLPLRGLIRGSLRPLRPHLSTQRRSFGSSRVALASTAASASPSAQDFTALTSLLLLRQSLQQYTELDGTQIGRQLHPGENHVIISRDRFLCFCAKAHVDDPAAALHDLEAAGVVVVLDDGKAIHLRPVLYLQTLELVHAMHHQQTSASATADADPASSSSSSETCAVCSTPHGFLLAATEQRIADLSHQEQKMREELRPAIARAAKWRRSVWGGALLFAGTQLAVISRLTYFDLDWDIMEPVSYCITIATSLAFYLYYLRFNEEHTYEAFDQRFLPKKVRQYAPPHFDWEAYERVCGQLVEERAMLERIRAWAERH